jgi:hypothetical protein
MALIMAPVGGPPGPRRDRTGSCLLDEVLAFAEQNLHRGCYMGVSDPPRTRADPVSVRSSRLGERPLPAE